MYRPSLEQVLRGAIGEEVLGAHYVDLFRYPSHGGFVSYLEPFAERFDTKLGHRVVRIDPAAKSVRFANGVVVEYERLISSIPLPDLIPLVQGVPQEVADAAGRLAFTQAVLINLGIGRSDLSESAITYFYDEDIIFSRVNLPHMFSPNNAPPGCGTIQAEIYFSDKYKPLRRQPHEFIEPVIADLRRVGFIRDDDKILLKDADVNRYANVIYDFDRTAALSAVHGFLDEVGIYYCGRYGDWNHAWTDEAFLSGEAAAKRSVESLR
jgi:protoporphyrinogen oxidase